MLTFCLKCKKVTGNVDSKMLKAKNGRTMSLPKFALSGCKKSIFLKEQGAKGILISLGLRTPLSKILLFGDILF